MQAFIAERNNSVFRLEVCVDDLAHSVQVVEADEDLLGNASNEGHWDSSVVVSLHDF